MTALASHSVRSPLMSDRASTFSLLHGLHKFGVARRQNTHFGPSPPPVCSPSSDRRRVQVPVTGAFGRTSPLSASVEEGLWCPWGIFRPPLVEKMCSPGSLQTAPTALPAREGGSLDPVSGSGDSGEHGDGADCQFQSHRL